MYNRVLISKDNDIDIVMKIAKAHTVNLLQCPFEVSFLERCPSQGELRRKEISENLESQGLTAGDHSRQVSAVL